MNLTAVLFAGGESRRMGVNKATLDWKGEPLWARQLQTLRELRPDELRISARAKPVWCPADMEVVLDEPPSRGPLSGLAAALDKSLTTHLVALAIDMPHMTSEHLQKLQTELRPGCGMIPKSERGFEPLCAFYPAEAIVTLKEALKSNDVSLQNLARMLVAKKHMKIYVIDASEARLYRNTNTPDEYRSAAREESHKGPRAENESTNP